MKASSASTSAKKNDAPRSMFSCPSCATKTPGSFCAKCGEKRVGTDDYSVRHYLRELAADFTSIDSKLVRSIWLLLSKPGFLSDEYFEGRRVRYIKPLQMFVFLNVVYYFSLSWFVATTFTTPLATQLHMNNYYPAYAKHQVELKLQHEGIRYEALEKKYDETTGVLSKTLMVVFIPIFAAVFYALFFRKRKFLLEHVIVATHFWSFSLVLLGVILPIIVIAGSGALKWVHVSTSVFTSDAVSSVVLQLCIGVYLFLMLRRFYRASTWYCFLSASIIAWSFFHLVWLYRFCLLQVTLRAI